MSDLLDTVLSHERAMAQGYSDRDIAHRLRCGEWRVLRRGIYLTGGRPSSREEEHRLAVFAVAPTISARSAISHQSAAVLHGIPLWKPPAGRVHVSQPNFPRSRPTATLYTHPSGPASDIVCIDGLDVVSAARTVVDLARTVTFEEGVVAADGALHRKLVTREELAHELAVARGRRGARRAASVLAFADGRSESVGESRSRVALCRTGLPMPELQVAVHDRGSRLIARCDFGYPELKIAAEFDGFVKYGRLLRPGEEPGDAVFREKRREDALRDAGWIVVRWIWDELGRPAVIVARLRRALDRARTWRR